MTCEPSSHKLRTRRVVDGASLGHRGCPSFGRVSSIVHKVTILLGFIALAWSAGLSDGRGLSLVCAWNWDLVSWSPSLNSMLPKATGQGAGIFLTSLRVASNPRSGLPGLMVYDEHKATPCKDGDILGFVQASANPFCRQLAKTTTRRIRRYSLRTLCFASGERDHGSHRSYYNFCGTWLPPLPVCAADRSLHRRRSSPVTLLCLLPGR